jgi:hypothetical protein
MITVSVEFKNASPSGKIGDRAVVGMLTFDGHVTNRKVYTFNTPTSKHPFAYDHAALPADNATDVALRYLREYVQENPTAAHLIAGDDEDGILGEAGLPHFGNIETLRHKGVILVMFDEAEEQTHAMYK